MNAALPLLRIRGGRASARAGASVASPHYHGPFLILTTEVGGARSPGMARTLSVGQGRLKISPGNFFRRVIHYGTAPHLNPSHEPPVRSAGFQPAVLPISNRRRVDRPGRRIGNPRYSRQDVWATTSALATTRFRDAKRAKKGGAFFPGTAPQIQSDHRLETEINPWSL